MKSLYLQCIYIQVKILMLHSHCCIFVFFVHVKKQHCAYTHTHTSAAPFTLKDSERLWISRFSTPHPTLHLSGPILDHMTSHVLHSLLIPGNMIMAWKQVSKFPVKRYVGVQVPSWKNKWKYQQTRVRSRFLEGTNQRTTLCPYRQEGRPKRCLRHCILLDVLLVKTIQFFIPRHILHISDVSLTNWWDVRDPQSGAESCVSDRVLLRLFSLTLLRKSPNSRNFNSSYMLCSLCHSKKKCIFAAIAAVEKRHNAALNLPVVGLLHMPLALKRGTLPISIRWKMVQVYILIIRP